MFTEQGIKNDNLMLHLCHLIETYMNWLVCGGKFYIMLLHWPEGRERGRRWGGGGSYRFLQGGGNI